MNTLDDLRRTLDQHAADVADPTAVVRATAVHHRVSAVRRRRRAGGAATVALAVVVGLGVALVPRHDGSALPAAPVVLGEHAPTTIRSLGYTYRTDGTADTGSRRAGVVVAKSDQPQLYSWTADQATEVNVRVPGDETWDSVALHFRDFVVVPPGVQGRLTVTAADGRVAVARYTLASAAPGYTRNGVTFRDSVAGRQLLGAAIAAPGEVEASTTVVLPRGETQVATLCTGMPTGYAVRTIVNGKVVGAGDCSDPDSFDPGAFGGYSQNKLAPPGRAAVVRVVVTRSMRSSTPVTGTFPHLRLGIGLYGPADNRQRLAGNTVDDVVEHGGHTWSMTTSSVRDGGTVRLPGAAVDRVAAMVWGAHGTVRTYFDAAGTPPQAGEFFAGGPAGIGNLWVPADAAVRARLGHGKGPVAVALYQRDD